MSKNINFVCPKCGNSSYDIGEIRTTGGLISKLLDIQNKNLPISPASAANTQNSTRLTAACSETFLIFSRKICKLWSFQRPSPVSPELRLGSPLSFSLAPLAQED